MATKLSHRSLTLLLFSALLLGDGLATTLQPNSTHLRVKTANLNGNLGFTLAEFGMTFDEPLYFQFPAPCPAGRCPLERQQAAIDADPCLFMPCDFTLKGAACGQARLPQCEALCASKRPDFCPPVQDWVTLQLGVESEPIHLSNRGADFSLRVNFGKICHAIVFRVNLIYGSGFVLPYHINTIDPNIDNNCQGAEPPEGINTICPAFLQCYQYGTYFLKMRNFEPNTLVTVIVSALEIEAGPQRIASLPDAPPVVIPDPDFPFHVPLQWSVPFVYTYPDASSAIPLILSTHYCGFVTFQINMEAYNPALAHEGYLAFVSLDPTNPFPSSLTNDMLFLAFPFTKVYICQNDTSLPPARVFLLVVRDTPGAPETITVTLEYDRPGLIPIAPPQKAGDIGSWSNYTNWPASNWYSFGSGALQLNCPGFPRFDCTAGCEKFGCCQNTWPAFPTGSSLQPLYPVPYPLRFLNNDIIYNDFVYFPKYLDPYTIGLVVVLEQNFDGSIQYGPLGSDWASILPQCTLSRAESGMGTLDGRWISGNYKPELITSAPCNYTKFTQLSKDLEYLFSLFIQDQPSNIGTTRPLSLRYRADIMTVVDSWPDCQAFMQGDLLEVRTLNLTATDTRICPNYDPLDPCCNPELAWNMCCVPRTVEFQLDFASIPQADFNATCQLSQCSLPVLENYVQGSLTEVTGACEPGILALPPQISTESIRAYSSCLLEYFGNDFTGTICYQDSDCPQLPSSRCDLIAHRCSGNISIFTEAFVSCLVDRISVPVRLSLIQEQGWISLVQTTPLADLITETYSAPFCIRADLPIPGTFYRPYYTTFTGFPGCPPGNFFSLSNSITPYPWQAARQVTGGNCAYDYSSVIPNLDATICQEAENYCNWNPSVNQSAECALGSDFCTVCESPSSCVQVASLTTAAACTGSVCLLADGQVVPGLTAAQCQAALSCTDGSFGNQATCEASGVCQDKEDIYYVLDNTPWAASHSRLGICAFPMAAYDTPDCNVILPGSTPSSYGCVAFGVCQEVGFILNCVVNYDTQATCQAAQGVWYAYPDSQAKCENPNLCDLPRYTGLKTATWESNYQYLSSFPSVSDCENCGGQVRPVNTWISNRWLPGQMRQVSWLSPAMVQPYKFITSLDFMAVSRINVEAAEASTASQVLNALQCSYGNQKDQIEILACNCLADLDRETCFQQNALAPIGQARFCPFVENNVVSPPFVLRSVNESLTADVAYQCIDFQLGKVASQAFDVPPVVPVTIAFKRRQKIPYVQGSYQTVYNSQEALVGAVIGDGLYLAFQDTTDAASVRELSLCETLPLYIQPDLIKYPIYDFGQVVSSGSVVEVRPLHLVVNYTGSTRQLCGLIPLTGSTQGEYVPIVRLVDDQSVQGTAMTAGEKACLYVVASLFAAAATVWLFMIANMGGGGFLHLSTPTNVVWFCSLWIFLQRSIYLYLVASDVLNQANSHQLADYFMMDFPMCVYLIANFQIGLSFLFLHLKLSGDKRSYWIVFSVGAFLIIMLFIGVLLAYRYQVVGKVGLSGPLLCPVYVDAAGTARTIRLIYQAIILFVAVCIGMAEAVLGSSIYRQMARTRDSRRILILCLVASIGIISDSVAFLIYYIVDEPHPYFSIVLIFTEIIPLLFLLFQLRASAIKNVDSLSATHSGTGAGNIRSKTTSRGGGRIADRET